MTSRNLSLVVTCYHAKFGNSTVTTLWFKLSTEYFVSLAETLPLELGAQNLTIYKLALCELSLKMLSQSVHNILSYSTNKQTETIALSRDFVEYSK